jgi:hypothetical protein
MNIPSIGQIEKVEHDAVDLLWRLKSTHSSARRCKAEIAKLEVALRDIQGLKTQLLKANGTVLRKTGTQPRIADPPLVRKIALGEPGESLEKKAADQHDAIDLIRFARRTGQTSIANGRDLANWRDRQ